MKIKDSFVNAFEDHVGSSIAHCDCGKSYYSDRYLTECGDDEVDLDDTYIKLDSDFTEYITMEGRVYCQDCNCWLERAERIQNFIDGHITQIYQYLANEKQDKIKQLEKQLAMHANI